MARKSYQVEDGQFVDLPVVALFLLLGLLGAFAVSQGLLGVALEEVSSVVVLGVLAEISKRGFVDFFAVLEFG